MINEIKRRFSQIQAPRDRGHPEEQISVEATAINVTISDFTKAKNVQGLERMVKILENNLGKPLPSTNECFSGTAYRIITNNNRLGDTEIYLSDLCFNNERDELVRISDIGILIQTKNGPLRKITFTRDPEDYALTRIEGKKELFRLQGKTRKLPYKMRGLSMGRLQVLDDVDQLGVNPAIRDYLILPFKSALEVHHEDIDTFLQRWNI